MDENLVFEALIDWNPWGNFEEKLKDREILPQTQKNYVLIIKGVRRCGKSRLTYLLAERLNNKDALFINFEDPRLKDIKSKDIIKIVELYKRKVNPKGPKLLVLDEVQNINGWENTVRLFSEAKKYNLIVTGSSSKLMSEEYATVLTGRHLDIELFPLSFREILMWNNININTLSLYKNKIKIMRSFDDLIQFGSFPAVFLANSNKTKIDILRQYFNDIVIKDIVKRFEIREINKIEDLSHIYLSNISTLQSKNKLKNIVNLSLDTVERFSKYFEIARLFFFINKFSYSIKQQILSVKKVYCIDTGFFSALGFRFSENIGRLMENLVAIELLRRKSYWHNDWEIYYWKDYQQREVDFVIKEGNRVKELIQVTYASDRDEIEAREIKSLLKASEVLKCNDLLVITWDYEAEERINSKKIKFLPLWKWLLK